MENVSVLMQRACERASAHDFGGETFREGLDRLVHALENEANLHEQGTMAMEYQIVDILASRLKVIDWHKRHPEADLREIRAPLIGLGLPRTASTALACMLGEDRASRSLLNWEGMNPVPPANLDPSQPDPRIALAEMAMERRAKAHPRLTGMLPSTADSPTECQLLMAHDFKSQIFEAFVHVPSYVDWLLNEADLTSTYKHVKQVLKLLAHGEPDRPWRLKNPSHSLFITDLDKVFPDAVFVMTHRNPVAVLGSVADLYYEYHKSFTPEIEMHAIGREVVEFCEIAMRRMIEFREAGNDHRFVDVIFDDFQSDPFPEIERVYRLTGEEFSDEARAAMQDWRERKPLAAAAYERTDPAEFGLDRSLLEDRFRFYTERFCL